MEYITSTNGFYLELHDDEVRLFTQHYCSSYPVWLGKNRANMKKFLAALRNSPPTTIVDFLEYVSVYNMSGHRGAHAPQQELLKNKHKRLDKTSVFY